MQHRTGGFVVARLGREGRPVIRRTFPDRIGVQFDTTQVREPGFNEAEQIAAQELDPQQASANVAYLRSILAQQNSWAKLSDKSKKTN